MRLVRSEPHETIPLLEHRTFECPACNDVEQRLMLGSEAAARPERLVPAHEAPPTATASAADASARAEGAITKGATDDPMTAVTADDVTTAAGDEVPPVTGDNLTKTSGAGQSTAASDQPRLRNAWALLKGRLSGVRQ
jgi:hypothetical protein